MAHLFHPGEGRGPVGKAGVMERCAQSRSSPNWAPAFAGVVGVGGVLADEEGRQ
ncbi:hypothetical protein C8J43_101302 [Sphingomonas sp. PP-CE-1G-424]|nr:hypothetical protein C8J43_101302 [Sphingomonas sp. PP-CE-1G-424]